jgi:hypothetical protein
MSTQITNATVFVNRNRTVIKTAVVFGLVIASVIGMAFNVDTTALAGSATGGTY